MITYGTSTSSLYVLKGLSGNTKYESASAGGAVLYSNTGMTYSDGVMTGVTNAYVWNIAADSSYYKIQNASTGTYLGSYNSYLYSRSSYSSSYCVWDLEYDTYQICMKVSNASSSTYPYLVKGSNAYFVINSGYTTNKTQFWKQTTASTTYYSTSPSGSSSHTHEYGAWTSNNNGTHSRSCSCISDRNAPDNPDHLPHHERSAPESIACT